MFRGLLACPSVASLTHVSSTQVNAAYFSPPSSTFISSHFKSYPRLPSIHHLPAVFGKQSLCSYLYISSRLVSHIPSAVLSLSASCRPLDTLCNFSYLPCANSACLHLVFSASSSSSFTPPHWGYSSDQGKRSLLSVPPFRNLIQLHIQNPASVKMQLNKVN